MKTIIKNIAPVLASIYVSFAATAHAELTAIDDAELSDAVAQGGLYLSGEFSLNEEGGPIADATYTNDCTDETKRCGARFAYKMGGNPDNGWYVIDDWKGEASFEGLTIRTRRVDSGFNGDGADFDKEVLEIGLPSTMKFNNYQYNIGFASHASPNDAPGSYQQTNLYGIEIDGQVNMSGNMLIFPTADK